MSDTPETDELRDLFENHEHRANMGDVWELCESLERQRDAYAETLRDIIWTEPDWSAIEQRHPELAENHPAVAPATRDSASLDDVVAG